jgi:hypothetical protein
VAAGASTHVRSFFTNPERAVSLMMREAEKASVCIKPGWTPSSLHICASEQEWKSVTPVSKYTFCSRVFLAILIPHRHRC